MVVCRKLKQYNFYNNNPHIQDDLLGNKGRAREEGGWRKVEGDGKEGRKEGRSIEIWMVERKHINEGILRKRKRPKR